MSESIMVAKWPGYPKEWIDSPLETRFTRMQQLVGGIREVRNRYMIDSKTPLDAVVRCSPEAAADFDALKVFIQLLAGVGHLECGRAVTKPGQAATVLVGDFETFVSLKGLIDPVAEVKRIEKQIAEKSKSLEGTRRKLADEKFTSKAPAEIIEQQKALVIDLDKQIDLLQRTMADFKNG